jgi:hypothetical protein
MKIYDKQKSIYMNQKLVDDINAIGLAEGTKFSITARTLLIRAIKKWKQGEL